MEKTFNGVGSGGRKKEAESFAYKAMYCHGDLLWNVEYYEFPIACEKPTQLQYKKSTARGTAGGKTRLAQPLS